MRRVKFIPLAISLLAAGCTVGPDYKAPDLSLPAGWFAAEPKAPVQTDMQAAIELTWWKHFNDPILNQLIEKTAADNLDLKASEARIVQARANRASASSDLLPVLDAKAAGTREENQIAFPGSFPGIKKPFNIFETGFDASWELDLFGGRRRALEGANADLAAAMATRDELRVSLLAEVARTYIDIRQYQEQLAIASDTISSEQRTVSIVGERFHAGNAPELDLTQSRAQLEQEQAQLPYYQNLLAQSQYNMDVLLGEQPGYTQKLLAETKPVPVTDKALVLAAPAKVIAQRPDIRTAERQLAAATAQQGVATAAFFPDISLSGFYGLLNVNSNELFKAGSKSWTFGGNVVLPFLNYNKLSAGLDLADAKQKEALATYQKSILSALSDVAKTVTAYSKQDEYRQALLKTVQDDRQATSVARMRYKEGLSSFIEVLDAERTLYNAQSQLATADAQSSEDLVSVYKSLGGGWLDTPAETAHSS